MKANKIVRKKIWLFLAIGLIMAFGSTSIMALTMEDAINLSIDSVADHIRKNREGERFVINFVNLHTMTRDELSSEIETVFYFALDKRFPEMKKILLSESTSGVSSRGSMFVNGTYNKKGNTVELHVQILKGLQDGELIAQTRVDFFLGGAREKTLVAILDLEAKILSNSQKKIYSEIFRSALNNIGTFDLASSAEVDKMSPDAIQKASGCTRDECATIIGQQLGVDRVISTSLIERSKGSYFLSGKLIDINDGSIVRAATVNHDGDINKMDSAFKELAGKIANVKLLTRKKETSGDKDVLVVFNLESPSSIREEVSGLTTRMQEEVLRSGKFSLIEQNELEEALRRLNYKASECTQFSCAVEVATMLKADRAIIGSAKRIAGKYWLVNASLLEVNEQKTIRTESIRSEGRYFELLGKGMTTLVSKLLALEKEIRTAPVVPVHIRRPVARTAPLSPSRPKSMPDSEISISLIMGYDVKELRVDGTFEYEVEAQNEPRGYGLRWGFRDGEGGSSGLSFISVYQEFKIAGSYTDLYFQHTGFELDTMSASLNDLRLGFGVGIFTTEINCQGYSDQSTPGTGYSFSLKIGYSWKSLSLYLSYYTMSGEATYEEYMGYDYGWWDYKYTWSATMTMLTFMYMF